MGGVRVEGLDEVGEEVQAGDGAWGVLGQLHGLAAGAAAEVGYVGLGGEVVDEAQGFQGDIGAAWALALEVGEVFTNKAEVEILNVGMFIFHDFCSLNNVQKPSSKVF